LRFQPHFGGDLHLVHKIIELASLADREVPNREFARIEKKEIGFKRPRTSGLLADPGKKEGLLFRVPLSPQLPVHLSFGKVEKGERSPGGIPLNYAPGKDGPLPWYPRGKLPQ
jgi:hypothetical protein